MLAARILALGDAALADRLTAHHRAVTADVPETVEDA
jgi:phosphoribosylcarboxyaminoimidazole (NCAIR) mutase